MKIVLTNIGNLVPYIFDCVKQARYWCPNTEIVLLHDLPISTTEINLLNKFGAHPIRFSTPGEWVEKFRRVSFHNGLTPPNTLYPSPNNWLHNTSERLLLLLDYMRWYEDPFIHIESDVLLYCNLGTLETVFRKIQQFAATVVTDHHMSCGFCWIPNRKSLLTICEYLLRELSKGEAKLKEEYKGVGLAEMTLLRRCPDIFYLPSCPFDKGYNTWGAYDGCAIGQWLGGTNLAGKDSGYAEQRNYVGAKILSGEFLPVFEYGAPALYSKSQDTYFRINSLHIHNKTKIKEFMTNDK